MTGPDAYVPHRGSDAYRVTRYELELDYRPESNALSGRARLSVELREAASAVVLDLVGLAVEGVRVDGRQARYSHRNGRLTVRFAELSAAGGTHVLDVRYSGRPGPQDGLWGEVGWEELTDGVIVAGQPDGAATWFPCNDLPGEKASFRTTVRTGSAYAVVANGELVSRTSGASTTTWVHEQAEPMAPYLATLQLGRYDEHRLADHPVPQLLLAPHRLSQRALADTASSPEMMALFTELFGPYPFSRYTVVVTDDDLEIPLEAQGISVLGANHVDGRGGSERLVAHELAHQWFGNSLTAAEWRHVWLHEGFACYAEWLWSEAAGGAVCDVLAATTWQRLSDLPQDLLLADPGPELMFDDRLYKRGALALHVVRRACGDEAFFDLLRSWVHEHRYGSVTTAGFVDHVERHAGASVAKRLRPWLEARPLPSLKG